MLLWRNKSLCGYACISAAVVVKLLYKPQVDMRKCTFKEELPADSDQPVVPGSLISIIITVVMWESTKYFLWLPSNVSFGEALLVSTQNICFCGEIRKISVLFCWKKCLIWSYDTVWPCNAMMTIYHIYSNKCLLPIKYPSHIYGKKMAKYHPKWINP